MKAGSYKPGGYRRRTTPPHICVNGPAWTGEIEPVSGNFTDVAWGLTGGVDGTWVVINFATNGVYVSTDNGVTNIASTSGVFSAIRTCIAYGNGIFMMPDGNFGMNTSVDGLSWATNATTIFGKSLLKFSPTFGKFFTVGIFDPNIRDTVGGAGFSSTINPMTSNAYSTMVVTPTAVVLLAGLESAHTTDGINWVSTGPLPFSPSATSNSNAAYGNGAIVTPHGGISAQAMRSTDDGVSWSSIVLPLAGSWSTTIFANGVHILMDATSSSVLVSADGGVTFTVSPNPGVLSSTLAGAASDQGHYIVTNGAASNAIEIGIC